MEEAEEKAEQQKYNLHTGLSYTLKSQFATLCGIIFVRVGARVQHNLMRCLFIFTGMIGVISGKINYIAAHGKAI
ncbi:MAG: hypothetical protein PHI27_05530 [Eubacteriales bacterium]|nr:hypothetical protein [Eubacteriales bacterium]MDD3881694.1 hypothetical protein [Eubacteriales bacterium]MDD4512247.1 hypothetical protein [Eubacteriales bacterium]